MNKSSFFIENKAIFGSFPTIEDLEYFTSIGVTSFVDLTSENENLKPYAKHLPDDVTYLNFPIKDRGVPENLVEFSKFIIRLCHIIKSCRDGGKIYIHCKGGHGRAGIVVACILCYIYKINPDTALNLTTKYHNNRTEMRPKWRRIGSPQTLHQKNFVLKICRPLYFYKAYKSGVSAGYSNFIINPIKTDIGNFQNAEAAFQAYKDINNIDYIKNLESTESPFVVKQLGQNCNLPSDWYSKKYELMKKVINFKFDQYPEFQKSLIESNLRCIYHQNMKDNYWGKGDGSGFNKLGVILMQIREERLLSNEYNYD
jgi:ribA/ribD-fused uncharacterized protein